MVKDEVPIEYEGILGADFVRSHKVTCNYGTKQITIRKTRFNLFLYKRITLQPRSETIIQVAANRNMIDVTRSEETSPGIFIGSCLVEPQNFICPVSIINTTEEKREIQIKSR